MKAISIKQPWAHYIITGVKPVENRSWHTKFRGSLLIHASNTFDQKGYDWIGINAKKLGLELPLPHPETFYCGGLIGLARLKKIVSGSWYEVISPWYVGPWGWVFSEPKEFFKPVKYKGSLGIFEVPARMESVTAIGKDDNGPFCREATTFHFPYKER